MSRKPQGGATPVTTADEPAFPAAIITSRWLFVAAVSAIIAFGSRQQPQLLPHYALIGAMIASNAILAFLRGRGPRWKQALEVATVSDVLVVAFVIGWVDPSPETYLAVFAALILASALGRVGVIMVLMLLLCGVYAGYLYTEFGSDFWRQVALVLRVPFIFSVGLYFASLASQLKTESARNAALVLEARQQTERADHLSREQDRLRALSQIGRLGLTGAEAHPVKVLLEMCNKAQKALGASRCMVVLLGDDTAEQGMNGRSKDRSIEVRTLPLGPDKVDAILLNGKLSELHPGDSKDLLEKVKVFFPDSNPFGSILAAPLKSGDTVVGVFFLLDDNHERKFSDGERDFFWTVSLMVDSFVVARERLENEVRLRTLLGNAPVIMFAFGRDGTIQLFEGQGSSKLGGRFAPLVGKSIFDVADNPAATREAFDAALQGRTFGGELKLSGTLFETQFSPLRGVDGKIAGVIGVTTAILEPGSKSSVSGAAAAPAPEVPRPPVAPIPVADAEPAPQPPDSPESPPSGGRLDPRAPVVPKRPLKPLIPLADPTPEDD